MKNLITTLFLAIAGVCNAQTYNYGAILAPEVGFTVKSVGQIVISDSSVTVTNELSDDVMAYDIVNRANGMLYFTDGVMTHYFIFNDRKTGEKKGFTYDTQIIWNFDQRVRGQVIVYYAKRTN